MTAKDFFPSVLACEKKLVPSDARFYGTLWNKRHDENSAISLKLIEKSVRGTISNRLKSKDASKLDAKIDSANLQTVDSCSLAQDQDTLKVCFTLKVLSGFQNPSACNSSEFQQVFKDKVESYISRTRCQELARRYATNLANARFLWRNRVGAQNIEVTVKTNNKQFVFDAFKYPLTFNSVSEDVALNELSNLIAEALSGQKNYLLLEIEACAQIGTALEVYPSEELILDKGQGKKSKVLFAVDGIAAMHSQKIGNAIRTIDDWYPDYSQFPIAVEPYGAVTTLGKAFRTPGNKKDFYTLFDNYMMDKSILPEDEHYIMAVLIRGGVFGDSKK